MRYLAPGPRLVWTQCDLRRIGADVSVGITPAVTDTPHRPAYLPTGRYLHNPAVISGYLSKLVAGNPSQPSSNSKAWLSFAEAIAGRRTGRRDATRRTGCPAALLSGREAVMTAAGAIGRGSPAHRPGDQMTKLSAASTAERDTRNATPRLFADTDVAEVHHSSTPANKISYEVTAVTTLEGPVADGR